MNFAFLDSGIGGLPYLMHLRKKSPFSKCIYVADTENFPYGEKTKEEIIEASAAAINLIEKRWSPNVIVIACNTITLNALDTLRLKFPKTKIIGTVPAIKTAGIISKKRCIGLLATNSSVNNNYTKELKEKFAKDCTFVSYGAPELIDFIEHKYFHSSPSECFAAVVPTVNFFKEKGCDVIILGCTHFLNISEIIKKTAGTFVEIIDSRDGVVKSALTVEADIRKKRFIENNENSPFEKKDSCTLYVTSQSKNIGIYKEICTNNGLEFGGIIEI